MEYYKTTFIIQDADGGTVSAPGLLQTAKDVVCALAAEAGFESFEEQDGNVCGYIQKSVFNADAVEAALKGFPFERLRVSYSVSHVEDRDWNAEWERQGFEPILIGDRCVIHDSKHRYDGDTPAAIDITIDARQAFGTGTHDTTRMMAAELLNMDLTARCVLDCGCGTGILSIVAAKTGAQAVSAYDIDRWSVDNTLHNCRLNGVSNVDVAEGDAGVIPSFNKRFDIVLANINRNILLADMGKFRQAMKPKAWLILSGFYTDDAPLLTAEAARLGLTKTTETESDHWCMLTLTAND